MTISDDTDDILGVWGETATIVRNTPTFDDYGERTDSWASVTTAAAEFQPMSSAMAAREIGFEKKSTHAIYLPASTSVRTEDRVRPSGWSTGDDEYVVTGVWEYEDHIEAHALKVEGHA